MANNSLSAPQKYKLNSWLERNQDSLSGLVRKDIAARASSALNFVVTEGNVWTAESAIGVKIGRARDLSEKKGETSYMAGLLMDMHTQLGMPVPDRLARMAAGKD